MKKTYLIIALTFLIVTVNAQFKWANRGGLWAYDYGYGVVIDNSGDVYVAGKFELNAIFSENVNLTCQGNHDAYIAKYNSMGAIQWVKTAGGPDGDYAWGISTDKTNYLYVAGEVEGTNPIIFQGSNITLNGAGDNDIFVAKYDLSGNLIWAKREGVVTSEKALAVANDNQGNVYICGYFTANTNFNGTAMTGFGGHDIFVAKYDGNGNFQWAKKAGSSGRDEARSIQCDNQGNVYVSGMFSGTSAFENISVASTDNFSDSFLAKMDASTGNFVWVKKGNAILDDIGWTVRLDNAGSIYVSGEFNSYIDWENSSMGLPTTGNTNVYVAKFDATGAVQWIRGAGGSQVDRARGMGTDGTNIYLTGQFGSTAAFGAYSVTAADSSDIFLAAIDANGAFMWAASATGPADTFEGLGYESGIAITADANQVIGTGGMLRDTTSNKPVSADFGGIGLGGYRRTDMYVVSIAKHGVGIKENKNSESIGIYPNPSAGNITLDFTKVSGSVDVSVYNTVGQLITTGTHSAGADINMDLSLNKEGIYLLEVKMEDNSVIRKKIILQH